MIATSPSEIYNYQLWKYNEKFGGFLKNVRSECIHIPHDREIINL